MEWTERRRECVARYFDLVREKKLDLEDRRQWVLDEGSLRDIQRLAEGLFLQAKERHRRTGKVDVEAWARFARVVRAMCHRRPLGVAQDLLHLSAMHPYGGGGGEYAGNFAARAYPFAALERRLAYEERKDEDGEVHVERVDEERLLALMEVLDAYPELDFGMLELTEGRGARERLLVLSRFPGFSGGR